LTHFIKGFKSKANLIPSTVFEKPQYEYGLTGMTFIPYADAVVTK